jgi:hypothetical protein
MSEVFKVGDWVVRKEKYRGSNWRWDCGDEPFEVESSTYNALVLVGLKDPISWSAHCFYLADPPNESLSDFL